MNHEVKRWEPENTIVGYNMRPCTDGSFVLAVEYDALLAALELAADKAAPNCTDAEWQQIVSVLRKARGE